VGSAADSAVELSVEAQKHCDLGRRATDRAARLAHFEQGQALAEQAVAADDAHADGHFALFCSLGEQMRIDGESWNPGSVFSFRRMIRELDRTLELNPNHLDALSSKGTLLVRLPGILGGDTVKGEQILRQVVQRDPKSIHARLTLAKTYADRGSYDRAVTLATEALSLAQADHRADLIPDAQKTLSELRKAYAEVLTVRR
jgi:tetratricopeptide (TPR) repeat protein